MVVDDFSEMREHNKSLLQEIGFCHIHEAEDGNVALDKLQAENFDFIVSTGRCRIWMCWLQPRPEQMGIWSDPSLRQSSMTS